MRMRLGGEIAALLAIKALALALIWYAFFSPAHQTHVDGAVTGERFGVAAAGTAATGAVVASTGEGSHD